MQLSRFWWNPPIWTLNDTRKNYYRFTRIPWTACQHSERSPDAYINMKGNTPKFFIHIILITASQQRNLTQDGSKKGMHGFLTVSAKNLKLPCAEFQNVSTSVGKTAHLTTYKPEACNVNVFYNDVLFLRQFKQRSTCQQNLNGALSNYFVDLAKCNHTHACVTPHWGKPFWKFTVAISYPTIVFVAVRKTLNIHHCLGSLLKT